MSESNPRPNREARLNGPAPGQPKPAAPTPTAVVIKKYANRRLYNTEASTYVTLEDLARMVRQRRDFVVQDAKSGEDITRGVLTQIIVEEEAKGRSLLPEAFLRQLIGFYGDSLQTILPRYLEFAMAGFSRQQEEMRRGMTQAMGGLIPFPAALGGLEELSKQNVAMMERAMNLFAPFRAGTMPASVPEAAPVGAADPDPQASMEALQREVALLRDRLAALGDKDAPAKED